MQDTLAKNTGVKQLLLVIRTPRPEETCSIAGLLPVDRLFSSNRSERRLRSCPIWVNQGCNWAEAIFKHYQLPTPPVTWPGGDVHLISNSEARKLAYALEGVVVEDGVDISSHVFFPLPIGI